MKPKYSEAEVREAVAASRSLAHATRYLGGTVKPDGDTPSYRAVRNAVRRHAIDTSHFDPYTRMNPKNKKPIEAYLTIGSKVPGGFKRRLIAEGLLIEKCCECGCGTVWNGKRLVLQLDHKNGVNNDNRIENLRLLCPNCHSQTETFTSRNVTHQRLGRSTLQARGPGLNPACAERP